MKEVHRYTAEWRPGREARRQSIEEPQGSGHTSSGLLQPNHLGLKPHPEWGSEWNGQAAERAEQNVGEQIKKERRNNIVLIYPLPEPLLATLWKV